MILLDEVPPQRYVVSRLGGTVSFPALVSEHVTEGSYPERVTVDDI